MQKVSSLDSGFLRIGTISKNIAANKTNIAIIAIIQPYDGEKTN
ncbi:hypothetical protein GVAMD_0163 [Gardnerella vaginalis AMD]|nr:hypothetical protein GVAMD_0163 [Gardnerella vaginalis AMD]